MISLAVLMVALNAAKPLDFSAFPTVLLFATLLRLSLNVASTRVVLVDGHEGPDAAGHVIEAFGHFLIGGDYAVGIFVFAILMVINLVVITKGAGRVSEVSARFTLDAMPGKQMAIDADLNAGLMTPEEAKLRRQEVATEADFYGSMDGASKFVKGDAVAGVLILVDQHRRRADPRRRQPRPVDGRCRLDLYPARDRRRARRAGARRCCCRSPPPRSSRGCPRRSISRARSPASSARPARGRRSRRSSASSACCRGCRTSSSCRPPASPAISRGSCAPAASAPSRVAAGRGQDRRALRRRSAGTRCRTAPRSASNSATG